MEDMGTSPKKGNTVLLTIIAVATLLVAVIGATFAYFSVTVTGNENANSVIVRTGVLGITFTDGQEINIDKLVPGDARIATMGKTFTVENTGDYEVPIAISWIITANDFGRRVGSDASGPAAGVDWLGQSDFYYSLTGPGVNVTSVKLMSLPETGTSVIVDNVEVPARTSHTYTLSFSFEDTNAPQNYDQDRTFSARLSVTIHGDNQFGS